MEGFLSINNKFLKRENILTHSNKNKVTRLTDKPSMNKYISKSIQTKHKYDESAKLEPHTKVIAHISESPK